MTPPVKPRTLVDRRSALAMVGSLVVPAAALVAAPRDLKVALGKNNSLPFGTMLRETREIRGDNGRRTITGEGNSSVNGTRYVQRVNLIRRIGGSDREEVSVRDSVRDCTFYLGAMPPPPNEGPTGLSTLDLRLRRVSGRWIYDLEKGTPTEPQRFALAEWGQLADFLSVLSLFTSTQPRAKGDTWKVDAPRVPGKGYGYVAAEGLECRLDDITEIEGESHARLTVSGKMKVERPLNLNGSVTITFAGTITRRLSDMLDVDTTLSGDFHYTGPVMALGKPATAIIELPWKLTRTQKIEPR